MDLRVVGTNRDPHFTGAIELADAAFLATASGARYQNGQVVLLLAADRVIVQQFHVEDRDGAPLDMTGSLGTRELTVGDLAIDAVARKFTLLSNEFGTMETDANLSFRGESSSPLELPGTSRGWRRLKCERDPTVRSSAYATAPTDDRAD